MYSPSFAANGSAVFFHAEAGIESALKRAEPGDDGELRVATIVDDGARNYHVRLSPDGTQVAFDSDRDGERGVYVADADGRRVRKVSGDGYAAVPTWAPDGKRLAFLRAEAGAPGRLEPVAARSRHRPADAHHQLPAAARSGLARGSATGGGSPTAMRIS